MAHFTRAKAIRLAKDNSIEDTNKSSSSTIQLNRPRLKALSIDPKEDQANSPMDDGTDAEIKGLKAAFRDAIGAGSKKRKNRNRKRNAKQNQLRSVFAAEGSGAQAVGQDENRLDMQSAMASSMEHLNQDHDQGVEASFLDCLKAKLTSPSASSRAIEQRTTSGSVIPSLRRTLQQARLETQSLDSPTDQFENIYTPNDKEVPWLKLNMEPRSFSDTVDAVIEHNKLSATSGSPPAGSLGTRADRYREVAEKIMSPPHNSINGEGSTFEMSDSLKGNTSTPKTISHASLESFKTAPTSISLTKRPIVTLSEIEVAENAQRISPCTQAESEDSFLTQTISRTPAKPVNRIEDTLEQLDIYEDEIEAVLTNIMDRSRPKSQESTPVLRGISSRLNHNVSPTTNALAQIRKSRESEPTQQVKAYYKTKFVDDREPSKKVSAMRSTGSSSDGKTVTFDEKIEHSPPDRYDEWSRQMPVEVNTGPKLEGPLSAATVGRTTLKTISKNPSSRAIFDHIADPKPSQALRKTKSMPFKTTNGQAERAGRPIVKSLLPPKQLLKSDKPTTRPAFELPGDAVARKLKEQREARLSQRDSGYDSPTGSSALGISKPTVKSSRPPTRPTFELPGDEVSRKKKEAIKAQLKAEAVAEKQRREFRARPLRQSTSTLALPRDTAASRARQARLGHNAEEEKANLERPFSHLSLSKRSSTTGLHRPSIVALDRATTPTIRLRAPGPEAIASTSTKNSDPIQPASAINDGRRTIASKRGKEIYHRAQALSEELEAEKREREAAAKRARAEAAEKGRQASREWAEKQRTKKAEKEQ